MKNYFLLLIISVILFTTAAGCISLKSIITPQKTSQKEDSAKPLIVENVSLAQKSVDLVKGEKIILKYSLKSAADKVEITFYNLLNQVVSQLNFELVPCGIHTVEWDGKTTDGLLCETGVYTYVIRAQKNTRQFTYNPAVNTGSQRLEIEKAFLDKELKEAVYVLPQAAWVRIRLGLREGALLNTLTDWIPQEAGRHVITWDGWDKDKLIQFFQEPNASLAIEAYSLPANSIIITGEKKPDYLKQQQWLISGQASDYPLPILSKVLTHEPKFSLSIADTYSQNKNSVPVVYGKVPITVVIEPPDKDILINSRFELVYFVDTVFLYEEEQANTPFTYIWDTTGLNEGEHIFTVNLLGYNMDVGINSIKVYVIHKSEENNQ